MPNFSEQRPSPAVGRNGKNFAQESIHPISQTLNDHQLYALIDNILPFEACLYYQVLPLSLEGLCLTVGIVDPSDRAAVAYVKQQLSYIHYSIRFESLASDTHRDLLSKYLNYTAKQRQKQREQALPSPTDGRPDVTSQTLILDPSEDEEDTGDLLDSMMNAAAAEPSVAERSDPSPQAAQSLTTPQPSDLAAESRSPRQSPPAAVRGPLQLTLDSQYRDVTPDRLSRLSPPALTQALLALVLDEGIGRLYFERRARLGRILWSRDGVLQAVVDTLDGHVLQAVIYEFKRLMHLSLIPVTQPKQVEIERLYEGERLLLRLRVMPGQQGEEATLQVLRGAALRFYQRQQIDRIGQDALAAAQVLQMRLDEIRAHARQALDSRPIQSKTLPQLVAKLRHMETEIADLITQCALANAEAESPL